MFSTDFEANKKALDQVAVIRNRALRNQIAGAIAVKVAETQPKSPTIAVTEGTEVEVQAQTANDSAPEKVSNEA
ncbi:MAG: hypothetical protein JRN52_11420 [Nitrososphaerota archaeon]|nr:hypothetical protein [Nitrososphaerota archaeon]